jgi:hypothetical protein
MPPALLQPPQQHRRPQRQWLLLLLRPASLAVIAALCGACYAAQGQPCSCVYSL